MAEKKKEELTAKAETEKKTAPKKDDGRVSVMVPYVEGEDPEVTVIVNYEVTKFRKGEMVKVKPEVAEVLANSSKQMMAARKNQEKFKEQIQEI